MTFCYNLTLTASVCSTLISVTDNHPKKTLSSLASLQLAWFRNQKFSKCKKLTFSVRRNVPATSITHPSDMRSKQNSAGVPQFFILVYETHKSDRDDESWSSCYRVTSIKSKL